MSDAARPGGRIVIVVDAAESSDFSFELARHASESVSPELLGLFIENAALLDYARSRLAREITRSGRERPILRDRLERQIRDEWTEARARFERAAHERGLRFSFRVARGELATEAALLAAEAEALVVGVAGRRVSPEPGFAAAVERLLREGPPRLLFARAAWSAGHGIAVVVDDMADAPSAPFEAAAWLAKQSGSPLIALLTGAALADRARAAQHVAQAAAARGAELVDVIAVRALTPAALERAVRFCRARLLVLGSREPAADAALVVDLLRRAPGALMLVRSAKSGPGPDFGR